MIYEPFLKRFINEKKGSHLWTDFVNLSEIGSILSFAQIGSQMDRKESRLRKGSCSEEGP